MGCQVSTFGPGGLPELILTQRFMGPVPHDITYYSKCMLGGALACGLTHAGITPLDVVKCNMQASATLFFRPNALANLPH